MTRHGIPLPLCLATVTVLALGASTGTRSTAPRSAQSTVDSFCASDFAARAARDSLVVYSSDAKRRAANPLRSEWFPLVDWAWDPLVIVTRYTILAVETGDSTGTALIRFDVVGRSQGRYQTEPTSAKSVVDTLRLVRRGARWWVLDPPLARVSVDAEIAEYSRNLASRDSSWFFGAAQPQLDDYSAQLRALVTLKRIAARAGQPR